MKHPLHPTLDWFTVGFAFDRDRSSVVLIKKEKQWCQGLLNGVGGSVESSDLSPIDAQRREFLEETGLALQNWEFFCQLIEPKAVVDMFRCTQPLGLLRTVRQTTCESVRVYNLCELQFHALMPNLGWLLPMASNPGVLIAKVSEVGGLYRGEA